MSYTPWVMPQKEGWPPHLYPPRMEAESSTPAKRDHNMNRLPKSYYTSLGLFPPKEANSKSDRQKDQMDLLVTILRACDVSQKTSGSAQANWFAWVYPALVRISTIPFEDREAAGFPPALSTVENISAVKRAMAEILNACLLVSGFDLVQHGQLEKEWVKKSDQKGLSKQALEGAWQILIALSTYTAPKAPTVLHTMPPQISLFLWHRLCMMLKSRATRRLAPTLARFRPESTFPGRTPLGDITTQVSQLGLSPPFPPPADSCALCVFSLEHQNGTKVEPIFGLATSSSFDDVLAALTAEWAPKRPILGMEVAVLLPGERAAMFTQFRAGWGAARSTTVRTPAKWAWFIQFEILPTKANPAALLNGQVGLVVAWLS